MIRCDLQAWGVPSSGEPDAFEYLLIPRGQSTLMDRLANDLLTSVEPNDRGFNCNPSKTYLSLQARGHVSGLCGWRSSPAHDCNASVD